MYQISSYLLKTGSTKLIKNNLLRKLRFKTDISSHIRALHLTTCLEKIVSFHLSDIGEGIREVTIKEWFVKVGDTVEQFDNLCEVQSDKASVTITSRYDGTIVKLHHNIDDIALIGNALIDFEVANENADGADSSSSSTDSDSSDSTVNTVASTSPTNTVLKEETAEDDYRRLITLATPAVRRLAMEHKVDLSKVPPTGPNGRVLKGDVLAYLGLLQHAPNVPPSNSNIQTVQTKEMAASSLPTDRTESIKGVRKAMMKSMSESLKIPHFAYSDEIDMTRLMEFRSQLQDLAREQGIAKLTFMPFCVKAASIALHKYPLINSSLDVERETLTFRAAHNISVAIDTPHGLLVPNIKQCQSKSIFEIAKDLHALVERGRAGALTTQDFADGTFSLSNIGVIGGTYTHPCIMAPQVAIGAMGRTKAVPRYNQKDEIVKAFVMNVSWCADHRVIDGVTMASFSNVWKQYLENPALFLLH